MIQAHVRDLLLKLAEGCPNEPELMLEAPPERDGALICPACGSTYARSQQIESACVAICPQCGCEFCPPMESIAKRVIKSVVENERHRRHLLDIPSVNHKPHKRTRQGGVGASHELAHKLLKQD